jgi:hypothetical protein
VIGLPGYSRIVFGAALPNHQQIEAFLDRNKLWIFLFALGWMVVGFGWRYYRYNRRRIVFPEVSPDHFRFHERGASGHSKKTLFTRIGGARNCLQVSVTDTDVWIRMIFPLNIVAENLDLEHRILRERIINVELVPSRARKSILLEYRDPQGQIHGLSLRLRNPDAFLKELKLPRHASA